MFNLLLKSACKQASRQLLLPICTTLRVKALKAINIDKARPLQMGLDRGKAAQCRKTASLKVESKKENSHADSSDNATR